MKMKIVILLTLLGLSSCSVFQGGNPKVVLNNSDLGYKTLNYYSESFNRVTIASENQLLIKIDGVDYKQNYDGINKIYEEENNIYVATKQGFYRYELSSKQSKFLPVPVKFDNPQITDIIKSKFSTDIYIATLGYGVFRYNNNKVSPIYNTPIANCLTETSDSSLWVGTNSGLVRIKNGEPIRYSEEIITKGFNVPDNIVEKLYADPANNLWIIMSEAISLAPPTVYNSQKEHTDLSSFPYIGEKGNTINNVVRPKPEDDFWLFATNDGLYMLYDLQESEESHSHGIQDKPERLAGDVKRFTFDKDQKVINNIIAKDNGDCYIFTEKALWLVPYATIQVWRNK